MPYPYSNLDPERFQSLAQALIVKAFPDAQCFPIGQPDGGRDATSGQLESKKLIAFQVKFVREADNIKSPREWILETLQEELPKIARTIPQGVQNYVLITNVKGSAHPGAGAIDKAQELINEHLSVPGMCWWKDDLDRRLDDAWDLKWAYPDLMTGPDLIRLVIERGLSEHQQRRANAIRSFVAEQFSKDEEVKFKQVELQNNLLDLFIDVPVAAPGHEAGEGPSVRKALLPLRK